MGYHPFILYWAETVLNQIAGRMKFKKRSSEREREDGNTREGILSFLHSTDVVEYPEVPDSLLSRC